MAQGCSWQIKANSVVLEVMAPGWGVFVEICLRLISKVQAKDRLVSRFSESCMSWLKKLCRRQYFPVTREGPEVDILETRFPTP
jgi:hypothetical protein